MAGEDSAGTGPDGSGSVSGLEGHLRNLIMKDSAPENGHTGESHASNHGSSLPAGHQAPSGGSAADAPGNSPQSSRTGRKRLNQAQRRQMSTQLSIPIDPRPPPPDTHSSRPSFGQSAQNPRYSSGHQQGHAPHQGMNVARSANWHQSNPQRGGRGQNYPSYPRYPASSSHQRDPRMPATDAPSPHYPRGSRNLYDHRPPVFGPKEIEGQAAMLEGLCWGVSMNSEIERSEIAEKEVLRQRIENISRETIARFEEEQASQQGFPVQSVELKCFGSLSSGFATKASDMDLGLLSPLSMVQPDVPGSPIPRLLEKALLDVGLGARLLSRTRVPIIKLCEKPPERLRRDLLAERERWEKGISEEPHDSQEADADEHGGVAPVPDGEEHADSVATEPVSPSASHFEVPSSVDGSPQRFFLKQGPKIGLAAYYGLAKRVLRKTGSFDVTISNHREMTEWHWTVLNRLCQAFVGGLSDTNLQQRLAQYPSLSFKPGYNTPNYRSLFGVLTQVEGEQLLQTWDNWSFKGAFLAYQASLDDAVRTWQFVQNASSFGADPLTYTKEIQLAVEKLKRVPVIQLSSLEQGPHDMPKAYHLRTKAIMNLFRSDQDGLSHEIQQATIDRYITGIHQSETREAVKASVEASVESLDLEVVACLHMSLGLAREFERAIDKGLYEPAQFDDIQEYIGLLRSPPQKVTKENGSHAFVLPVPPHLSALIETIRGLNDPHSMAPNRPRDRYQDPLEFPKTGAGVQCDINFSAHLALQNTLLLRCYSYTDRRVRPMVLFVKHWAKMRGINSGYRGTLSSYGYVLMVLHYLVNVVQPFVCPNLQLLAPPPLPNLSPAEIEATVSCRGYNVHFWRDEQAIVRLAEASQLNHNKETVGHLLRGFFEYYAHNGNMSNFFGRGFDWGRDVLSLRTDGGLLSKQTKGWTGAKTVFQPQGAGPSPSAQQQIQHTTTTENGSQSRPGTTPGKEVELKEVRHRYLFAIEDPFEIEHNVARTVTHNGIVSIRDEFRRAWRIIRTSGLGEPQENLLQDVAENEQTSKPFLQLLDEIHGSHT